MSEEQAPEKADEAEVSLTQHLKVLAQWVERDLTEAARAGELEAAYEVDDLLAQVSEVLAAGRFPILVGDHGVGKTAVLHELVRRAEQGSGPERLRGRHVVQMSIRRRAGTLKESYQLSEELQKLQEALVALGDQGPVPFFRDFHMAYGYDLEPQLDTFGYRELCLLGEGEERTIQSMLEYNPGLQRFYVPINVAEPEPARALNILQRWRAQLEHKLGTERFCDEALEEALSLTHRFNRGDRLPRSALELLGQVGSLKPEGDLVTQGDVIGRFSETQRVPRMLLDPEVTLDLEELEGRFSLDVLGQAEAVRTVVQMVGLIKAGLSDIRRPFGVFLFVGPTGVGKTHVAQLLARWLFGSADRLVRLNMADFKSENDAGALFGYPHGAPQQQRGVLTRRLSGQPFAVLLLDEFEKAHADVHDRFFQLFDEGSFINGANEFVSCRSVIIIATTNAGAEVYRFQAPGFGDGLANRDSAVRELNRRLVQTFRFELLNRFDHIVHFFPLTREHIRAVAHRELEALKEREGIKRRKVTLEVDDVVLDWLTAHGYDAQHGARFLRRVIERNVTTALAEVLVSVKASEPVRVWLTVRHNRIHARRMEPTPARREVVVLPMGTTEVARTLDRSQLLGQIDELIKRIEKRLSIHEKKKEEASTLLARMGLPDFWDRRAETQEVLEQYRQLDVAIQVGERLAEPLTRLVALREEAGESGGNVTTLARGLEEAAGALREWDERLTEEGVNTAWLVLSKIDPLLPATQWLKDLASMELAWCEKLSLGAMVVAVEQTETDLSRVVLEIEGPGVKNLLEMEKGLHRLSRSQGSDLRVRMELLERGVSHPLRGPRPSNTRKRKGPFDLEIAWSGRLELAQRGLVLELLGADADTLGQLLYDLERHWGATGLETPVTARVYGQDGSGARDPRSGVVVPRLKDVLRGELDKFLEGWRKLSHEEEGRER